MIATRKPKTAVSHSAGLLPWMSALVRDNITLTVLLMVVVVPLLTGTDLLNTRGKLVAFEGLGALLTLLALSQARLSGLGVRLRQSLTAGPNLPVALLALFALVSCAFVPSADAAYSHTEAMRIGFCALLYFVLAYHLRGKGHLQTITDGLLLVTAAVSLYGLSQMSSSDRMVEGSFGSHELMGSFLMLMLPLALALGLTKTDDTKRQLAAQSVALLATACLLMARSRSAWIGGGVSLVALSVLAWRFQSIPKSVQVNTSFWLQQVRQRKHMIVGPLLVLGGALALFVLLSQTGTMLQQRAGTMAKVDADASFQTRLAMDRGALRMALDKPLFGWGVGTYPIHAAQFTGFGDDPARVLAHGTSHSNLAHDFYLQTAAELGFVGLGLYLTVLVAFFAVGLRALPSLPNGLRRTVLIGCLAAMIAQAVDALGSPAYNFASVSLFQWVLMGLGMSAAGLGTRVPMSTLERSADVDAATGVSRPLMRGLQYGFAGLIALGVVSQIVPTMSAAFAQTCTVGGVGTFRTQVNGLNAIGPTQSTTVVSTFNGKPAHGVRYVETYSPTLAAAGLVTITMQTDYSLLIQRNTTPAPPNGARVTIRATYFDSNNRPYQNTSVTIMLN